MPDTSPQGGREATLLGFDFGEKKIGVAIGNTLTRQARPLEIIFSELREARFGRIAQLLAEWQPQCLVVGLALAADGGEQPATARCRRFANQLNGRFGLPVVLVDERGSSLEAQDLLKGMAPAPRPSGLLPPKGGVPALGRPGGRHAADDAMAAMIILQRHLDTLP
ncbi:MAG TPA: Holliday junction resolvase RuvX [Bordetella sp.]